MKQRSITQNAEEYAVEEGQNLKCGMIQINNAGEATCRGAVGWASSVD